MTRASDAFTSKASRQLEQSAILVANKLSEAFLSTGMMTTIQQIGASRIKLIESLRLAYPSLATGQCGSPTGRKAGFTKATRSSPSERPSATESRGGNRIPSLASTLAKTTTS